MPKDIRKAEPGVLDLACTSWQRALEFACIRATNDSAIFYRTIVKVKGRGQLATAYTLGGFAAVEAIVKAWCQP